MLGGGGGGGGWGGNFNGTRSLFDGLRPEDPGAVPHLALPDGGCPRRGFPEKPGTELSDRNWVGESGGFSCWLGGTSPVWHWKDASSLLG